MPSFFIQGTTPYGNGAKARKLFLKLGRPFVFGQLTGAGGELLAVVEGSQASSRIGSLQGADLLLEIPAELGQLEAGTELWAQLLRLPLF